jgi:hypothetical protein
LHRRFPERQRAGGRNKQIGDGVVVTAGSAQSDALPSIEDLAVGGGEKQDAHGRGSVGPEPWLVAIEDPASAHDPHAMLTAAPERPPTGDAIAAVDRDSLPGGPERSAGNNKRVAPVDFVCRGRWQTATEEAIQAPDHQAPTGGPINLRDCFDNPHQRHRVSLLAAQRPRDPQAEQSRPRHGLDQRHRQPASPLAFFCGCLDLRCHCLCSVNEGGSITH